MKKQTKKQLDLQANLANTQKQAVGTIHVVLYSGTHFSEQKIKSINETTWNNNEDTVAWIQIRGTNDTAATAGILNELGLSKHDIKTVLATRTAKKACIQELDQNLLIVIHAPSLNTLEQHMALLLGKNYVLTLQQSQTPFFNQTHQALKTKTNKTDHNTADYLLLMLLNERIDSCNAAVTQLEDALEEIEDRLLDFNNNDANIMAFIQEKRREIIRLRKEWLPLKEQFPKLIRCDKNLIHKKNTPLFSDLDDQITHVLQNLEYCREIMSSLVDLYLSNNDLKLNLIMKQLTVVATIFIPLTFLVGVWGMNFDNMPELKSEYGYFFSWGLMGVIGVVIWVYFKRKKWF